MPAQHSQPPTFCEPMECLAVTKLPEGPEWLYEVKLDGYRAQVVRDSEGVRLLSRRGKTMDDQFPAVLPDLARLPSGTVLDGELVALDADGRPNFNLLQNARSSGPSLVLFAFDILMHDWTDTKGLPLDKRRDLLASVVPKGLANLQLSESFALPAARMIALIREHGLEGAVAKRLSSTYAPGRRSGAWVKLRVNRDQSFVVGGYVPGSNGFDSIVVGVYEVRGLRYVARVRAGFVPASRVSLFRHLELLRADKCPFTNLPQSTAGRWGQGLTAEKMKECVWVRPEIVVRREFVEWTEGGHVRHIKFMGLQQDEEARAVRRESLNEVVT